MISRYSPFPGKQLTQVTASDLDGLTTVREGWYVEYKRELPNPKAIAKSISAFANTYGGWLFIGVEEESKENNVAGSCPGIPLSGLDGAMQSLRQSTASHLNPTPHFEVQVVHGPNLAMGLSAENCVVCIEVSESALTPHVHSSGVIYRRVSDGSEPKPETDRHQLELLWRRREKIQEEYKRWIERSPERSEEEEGQPYLRLLLDADMYRTKGKSWNLSVEDVWDTLNDRTSGPGLPLETVYPSANGIVARQTSSLTRHEAFGLTWIVGSGLRCEIWLPINTFSASEPDGFASHLGHYQQASRFISKLRESKANRSRILDLNQILMVLIAIVNMYLKLLSKAGMDTDQIHSKVILSEVGRTIPFLDSGKMQDRADKYGLPVCLTRNTMAPGGTELDSFFPIKLLDDATVPHSRMHGLAFMLFDLICFALGLEGIFTNDPKDEVHALVVELLDAWERTRDKGPAN